MGKKKKQTEKNEADDAKPSAKELKGRKNYKGGANEKANVDDAIPKIVLPQDKEIAILDLIHDFKSRQKIIGSISQRLSIKKLTDMYNALSDAGFKPNQIEQAMNNVVHYGGDLIEALDWLCLNLPNDQLPKGFSQTLSLEEKKLRPKFNNTPEACPAVATPRQPESATNQDEQPEQKSKEKSSTNMKSWILDYAQQSSEDSSDDEEKKDPNCRYLVLTAKLLDAKEDATIAKDMGDKVKQKQLSKEIREYIQEMDEIETLPQFNNQLKIHDVKESAPKPRKSKTAETAECQSEKVVKCSNENTTKPKDHIATSMDPVGDDLGLAMFEEQAEAEKPKPKPKSATNKVNFEKREFVYTRQQWTGKSPKQFLIDWVRKNLPKSPPPSYEKVRSGHNLWRSKCRVRRKDDDLVVLPDKIVCENLKEAEHLASTLALYNLCKGQRVHMLLPPPYRECWLDWYADEEAIKAASQEKENKPRDQYISKLLKKLKVSDDEAEPEIEAQCQQEENDDGDDDDDDDVGDTWEDLASDEEEETTSTTISSKSAPTKKATSSKAAHTKKTAHSVDHLRKLLEKKQCSKQFKTLLETRQQLPIYRYKDALVSAIRQCNALVIAGDTGSGKSTQIPHFILEDLISSSVPGNIVCTEPRRISAISLAQRVCNEFGEAAPGSRDTFCGYQIRFEAKRSETTRLLYCTTGVLLRKLQLDPMLSDLSHVIVDEVHERSVQSDFLLIVLRRILEQRNDFKVILMSATADSEKFSTYLKHCPVFNIPGRMFPVEVSYLEDVVEKTKYHLEDDSPYTVRYDSLIEEEKTQVEISSKGGNSYSMEAVWCKEDVRKIDKSGLDTSAYSHRTRNIVTRMNPDRINMELIVELIAYIGTEPTLQDESGGAVLIFMPGLSHIQELMDLLQTDSRFSDPQKYQLIALHSVLSSSDQSLAFSILPPGMCKIVIATNIAETGVTIPDVVYVIDAGKVKETRYMESSQLSSLQEVYISQASGKQRAGRAGRVRDGYCFRLYTHHKWKALRQYTVPEILRVPLEELCLHIMKCDYGHPVNFLSEAIDPPQLASVERAMNVLREIGACEYAAPNLTPLGHHLAALPVNVRVGKMLIYAAILGCLEHMSVVAAAMTEKSPFAVPMGKRTEADAAKNNMAIAQSDHITVYKAYIGWKEAAKHGYATDAQYCNRNFLKRSSLIDIENVATDLCNLVRSCGFQLYHADQLLKLVKKSKTLIKGDVLLISKTDIGMLNALSPQMIAIMKCVLAAGLYPNVALVSYTAPVDSAANPTKEVCMAQTQQGPAAIHPASVNRFLGANGFLVYHEKVRLSRIYLRDSTLVSGMPLLLFGGSIAVQHSQQLVTLDSWIQFKAPARTGVMFKELRILLNEMLARKLSEPDLNLAEEPLVQVLLELIATEKQR